MVLSVWTRLLRFAFLAPTRPIQRKRGGSYADGSPRRGLGVESLETRLVPASPDLIGYDARPGNPNAYFHVEEISPSWGDVIHLDWAVKNVGTAATTQLFNIGLLSLPDDQHHDLRLPPSALYGVPLLPVGSFAFPTAGIFTVQLPASSRSPRPPTSASAW